MNTSSLQLAVSRFSPRRLLACALLASLAAAQAAASESLLNNGTFEKANSSGEWPAGWGRAKNVSWESEPGNYYLRLASPAPGTHVSLYQKVTLPADVHMLELSFRTRVSELALGAEKWYDARVIMNFRDATGKVTTAKQTPYFNTNTDGWRIVVYQITVPPGSVTLEIMPSLFRVASGVFEIDDLVLKPLAATPAP